MRNVLFICVVVLQLFGGKSVRDVLSWLSCRQRRFCWYGEVLVAIAKCFGWSGGEREGVKE